MSQQLFLQPFAGEPLVAVRARRSARRTPARTRGAAARRPSPRRRRSRDSGSRAPGSGRTRAWLRARPCRRRPHAVFGEAVGHLRRRAEDALAVAAPLALGAVQSRAVPDGHERVLEHGATLAVRVDVAGRHRLHAEGLGEIAQCCVAPRIAALVRTLKLDEEALTAERRGEPGGGIRIAHGQAVAGAAGQADESFVALGELVQRKRRLEAIVRVREREQPAEVRGSPGCTPPAASRASHPPTSPPRP